MGVPAAAAQQHSAADPPGITAGSPNVFRCIFEDQPRMVIIRPAPGLWVAFNPATCTIDKIWRGGMKFRGKVWDFSQDNCAPSDDAVVWAERDRTLARLPDDGRVPEGWTLQGVEPLAEGGWRFAEPGASIISPPVDACVAMIAFDETGRESPLRVDVSLDGGATWAARSFLSTMHGTSDTDWQFNFRQITTGQSPMRVRLAVADGRTDKRVRRLRLTQDGPNASLRVLQERLGVNRTPTWRGYERPAASPDAVVLLYDIGAPPTPVRHRIHAESDGQGLRLIETIDLTGVPPHESFVLWVPRASSAATREYQGAETDLERGRSTEVGFAASVVLPVREHASDHTVLIVTQPKATETAP